MSVYTIRSVHARQLIDCKCRPLVEVDVITEGGALGRGAAPTGTSVGMHESFVLRDQNPAEYEGLGVRKAVANVNEIIAPKLVGMDVRHQVALDQIMITLDGTSNKHVLGSNAIYATSVALLRAAAASERVELYEYLSGGNMRTIPIPSFNVINGGRYGAICQAFNDFLIMPYRAAGIEEAVEMAVLVFRRLGRVIEKYTGQAPGVGRSYGWIAPSEDPEECLKLMVEAIDLCGYTGKCAFCLDCASSEMYDTKAKTYYLNGANITRDEQIAYIKDLTNRYPFIFVEDILDENDWAGYKKAHKEITNTLLIGDDFTVSSKERIIRATEMDAIDGFILKPNQIGTISEALDAHSYAQKHGKLSITSGRSGGVLNDVVMDLAVGLQIPFIKNGCPRSGERIDKLNYLMRVADLHHGCVMSCIDNLVRF